ncbi:amidase [Myriangium duriaei CBS 260.36]|uniref:amidase n=1 Tax=Myriangium duriaei CBS 260.36 TaxID=1168546 RepID=A0A9P4J1R1_9PEZI|nr:amidase [Myriangium duriaei CBS 260.36]
MTSISTPWQERARAKRQRAHATIPQAWLIDSSLLSSLQSPLEKFKHDLIGSGIVRRSGILTEREIDITENYPVSDLLAKLAAGEFSSLEVTIAFSKRAAIAQQLTECLTETMFDFAQERAKYLDGLRTEGKPLGPLHGLPISIKDGFQVEGYEATIGLVAYLDNGPSKINACLVDMLLDLGAVLYVKTNIPQTMMTADSHNNVFGRVLNPWNTALTAGGSSGGEGALVAFRGSPLGIGTDIAGSIRIPALCCGTYGFKPTASRLPYGKQVGCSNVGLRTITACAGPLANDFRALSIFTQAMIDARPALYDSTTIDIPWRSTDVATKPKLRIGLLPEDRKLPLQPPVRKAVDDAVELLEAQGHEMVPLSADKVHIANGLETMWKIFGIDPTGGRIVRDSGEPDVPSRTAMSAEFRRLSWDFVPDLSDKDGLERLATLRLRMADIAEDWRKIWIDNKIDAVIGPAAQNTAVPHDTYNLPPYTAILNLLDYPAAVIPFSKASKTLDVSFHPTEQQSVPPYDPELLDGAPCSIQVFTSRMRDEECLAIAEVIDDCLHAK